MRDRSENERKKNKTKKRLTTKCQRKIKYDRMNNTMWNFVCLQHNCCMYLFDGFECNQMHLYKQYDEFQWFLQMK